MGRRNNRRKSITTNHRAVNGGCEPAPAREAAGALLRILSSDSGLQCPAPDLDGGENFEGRQSCRLSCAEMLSGERRPSGNSAPQYHPQAPGGQGRKGSAASAAFLSTHSNPQQLHQFSCCSAARDLDGLRKQLPTKETRTHA